MLRPSATQPERREHGQARGRPRSSRGRCRAAGQGRASPRRWCGIQFGAASGWSRRGGGGQWSRRGRPRHAWRSRRIDPRQRGPEQDRGYRGRDCQYQQRAASRCPAWNVRSQRASDSAAGSGTSPVPSSGDALSALHHTLRTAMAASPLSGPFAARRARTRRPDRGRQEQP